MVPRFSLRLLVAVLVLLTGVPLAGVAVAYPGEDDVRRAQEAVEAKAQSVGEMQQRLTAAQQRMDAADVALGVAAEDYDQARIRLATATQRSADARKAAGIAAQRLTEARVEVGRIAASAYRDGGVSTLDVVLSASGPQEVLDRASTIQGLGQRQQSVLRRVDSTRATSDAMAADAARALLAEKAAADEVAEAKAAAEAQSTAAHATYQSQEAVQAQLLTELAAARRTSVAVEQARQAGLAEQKRREEEAAALERSRQAARERAAQAAKSAAPSKRAKPSSSSTPQARKQSSSPDGPAADPAPEPSTGGSSSGSAGAGAKAVSWARTKVGLPYLWGGDGPDSYDCSGLTQKAWAQAGVSLPHSSRLQYTQSEKIDYDSMRPGDLIFWATDTSRPSSIHHVAMYAGGGMMVEAPRTGLDVRVVPVRWANTMPFAGRP